MPSFHHGAVEIAYLDEGEGAPILLVHGLLTDAMLESTVERMMARPRVSLIHVPQAGHTPTLSDPIHIELLRRWLHSPADWPREMTTSWTPRPERFLFR